MKIVDDDDDDDADVTNSSACRSDLISIPSEYTTPIDMNEPKPNRAHIARIEHENYTHTTSACSYIHRKE